LVNLRHPLLVSLKVNSQQLVEAYLVEQLSNLNLVASLLVNPLINHLKLQLSASKLNNKQNQLDLVDSVLLLVARLVEVSVLVSLEQ